MPEKQVVLKPQDLLIALKIAVGQSRNASYARLGEELGMSASEAHASVRRATYSGFLSPQPDGMLADTAALHEFIIHGVRYSFPPVFGPVTGGLPTAAAGPALRQHFPGGDSGTMVWPSSPGSARGTALYPLYPSIPAAVEHDDALYRILSLVDAVRAGGARERELAIVELRTALA